MKSDNKLALLISDTHIGSTVGLWPKSFTASEGHIILPNPFQEWLYECWTAMEAWAKSILGNDPYDLILNGDLVEGQHHRTIQIMTADLGDQSACVRQILSPFASEASQTHVILGTECHTRNDELRIGAHLGASIDPSTGQHAWNNLDIEFHGALVNVAHHISASSKSAHEAGEHSRNLCDITHCRGRVGKPIPKVVYRAHRHRHGIWTDGNQMSVTTGAWQGLTRHGNKVVPNAIPQPSAVILDWRNAEYGDVPTAHGKMFTAP